MTYGPPQNKPFECVTIRPGPVLHVFRNGQELAAIKLSQTQVLDLIGQLAGAAHFVHGTPRENMTFETHKAERDAARADAQDQWRELQAAGRWSNQPPGYIGSMDE